VPWKNIILLGLIGFIKCEADADAEAGPSGGPRPSYGVPQQTILLDNSVNFQVGPLASETALMECTANFFEMILLQRMKMAYGCETHYRPDGVDQSCAASECSKIVSYGGSGRQKCSLLGGTTRNKYPDELECLLQESSTACGYGPYGATVGRDRNTKKCVCQLLDYEINSYIEKAKTQCPQGVASMLCIPTLVQSIASCSFPGVTNPVECVERRLSNGAIKGASVPGCYLHSCNYLQHLFNVQLPKCVCESSSAKKEWKRREWFVFENQARPTSDVKRYEPIAARDMTLKPTATQVTLTDRAFTDFPDPQACNRFIRCFNNGPCFNSTDGGYCPQGEHFHVNEANPAENGCYPASQVDCQTVPITTDSLGVVPVCFVGNEDFSDVYEAGDTNNVGELEGIRVSVDDDGFVGAVQFRYAGVWVTRHGTNKDGVSPAQEYIFSPSEHVSQVAGSTIEFGTIGQQVAKVDFTVVDRNTGQLRVLSYGNIPRGVPATPWAQTYPPNADPKTSCPVKYFCGSKTRNKVQVLTVHWHECRYSSNAATKVFTNYVRNIRNKREL